MEGNAVHDGAHGVFPNAEVQVSAARGGGPGFGGDIFRPEGGVALDEGVVGSGQVGGAAPQFWQGLPQGLQGGFGGFPGGHGFAHLPGGQVGVEPFRQFPGGEPVKQGLAVRVGGGPLVDLFLPCRMFFRTTVGEFPGVGEHRVVDEEVDLGVEPECFLGGFHLIGAQGGAVHRTGVHLGGGREPDDSPHPDEGGAGGVGLCLGDSLFDGGHVFPGGYVQHLPPVGPVAGHHVFGEGDAGVFFDGNPVVVPEHDEVAELLRAGEG